MNSHLYKQTHALGQTLYDKLRLKYTDEEIVELIKGSIKGDRNEHSNETN